VKTTDQWLAEYSRNHRDDTNQLIHWICVPMIVAGLVGLLWSLPVPLTFRVASPALNWGTVFLMASVVYYFILSISLAIGSLPFVLGVVAAVAWLDRLSPPLWLLSVGLFAVGWTGQFLGHWHEGSRPAFLRDLQFLMIGPLWLVAGIFRRFNIPY
jgi:uncharacterized membrane protein YGL010W